jgi:hypothetical protein
MKIIITEGQLSKIINKGILSEGAPTTYDEIINFQTFAKSKGFKNVAGKNIGQLISADGNWGDNSKAAWIKYGNSYKPNPKNNQSNVYPYDVLSKNPKPKDIAEIIKKSNGGWFRNDYEDWAEAAFNKIINKVRYNEVSKLLGKDVYQYILNYMKTSKIYRTGPSIYDTYQKLFNKVKVDTLKKPKTKDEIINFQTFAKSKGFKNVAGNNKGQLISVDGRWGRNSEAAWIEYGNSYKPNPKNVKTDNVVNNNGTGGYVIPFAFPDYQPECDGKSTWDTIVCNTVKTIFSPISGKEGTYGKLGHAGVATVTKSGGVQMFEFGRYTGHDKGGGLVKNKNLGNIAKIVNGKISNIDSVINSIHRKTEGSGPTNNIEYATIMAPNIEEGIAYAKSITKKDYSAFDFSLSNDSANCATYALEVVKNSGVPIGNITGPTPVGMIDRMKYIEKSQDDNMFNDLINLVV